MKKLTGLFFLLCCVSIAKAQIIEELYKESFEGAVYWRSSASFYGKWAVKNTPLSAPQGTRYLNFSASDFQPGYILSPPVVANNIHKGDSIIVSFYFYRADQDNYNDSIQFMFLSGNAKKITAGSFGITRYYSGKPGTSNAGWVKYTFKKAAEEVVDSSGEFAVAFEAYPFSENDLSFDDIEISLIRHSGKASVLHYIYPLNGNLFLTKQNVRIQWSSSVSDSMDYQIMSEDHLTHFAQGSGNTADGGFYCSIPVGSSPGYYFASITDQITGEVYNSPYFYVDKSLEFSAPTKNDSFYCGQNAIVRWDCYAGTTLHFFLKNMRGETLKDWTSSSGAKGSYLAIPYTPDEDVYIEGRDNYTGMTALSDTFKVLIPALSFEYPKHGQAFKAHSSSPLKWITKGIGEVDNNATLRLNMMDSAGTLLYTIVAVQPYNTASRFFTTPSAPGKYMIQAVFYDWPINKYFSYLSDTFTVINGNGMTALDNHHDTIELYPNPAKENIWISLNAGFAKKPVLEIYDLQGCKVYEGLWNGNGNMKLDISSLSPGAYILKVEGEEASSQKVFMVMP